MILVHSFKNKCCSLFQNWKYRLNRVIPSYAWIPLISLLAMNFITYYGSQLITVNFNHYDISSFLPDFIPFCSSFVLIYLLAYLQWVIGYIMIARESKEVCYEIFSAELIAKFLCLICFLVFPTMMIRPEIVEAGWSFSLLKFVYQMDLAVNLFPSIHCLESWMCFRGSLKLHKVSWLYQVVMFISAILVFLSTILIRQHVLIDIVGGILAVEIGLLVAKKFHTGRIFESLLRRH